MTNEPNWHCFCDVSYFDKWAVQHKEHRGFYQAIHVNTKEEAEYLVEQLNQLEAQPAVIQQSVETERLRIGQLFIDAWNELDGSCKKCDDANEEQYTWCDFACIIQNHLSGVLNKAGVLHEFAEGGGLVIQKGDSQP